MKKGFKIIIGIGILLVIMFLIGQTGALFNYDFAVSIGMQESEEEIGKVGIAFAKGFGFGDTVFYLPLFIIGIIGLIKKKTWGLFSMFGALAITVYWPLVNLYAMFIERTAINLRPDKYTLFLIILIPISIYGLLGMWYLYKNKGELK